MAQLYGNGQRETDERVCESLLLSRIRRRLLKELERCSLMSVVAVLMRKGLFGGTSSGLRSLIVLR